MVKKKQIDLKRVVEALLFVASEPLPISRLEALTDGIQHKGVDLRQILKDLEQEYEKEGRSFRLRKVGGGYQLRTGEAYTSWIRKLFQVRRTVHLSQPALETLAIIAYKQPITRTEIEVIRGVNVDGILKSLLDRELIKISGQKEVVGRPYLYRTCRRFLEHFGLNSLTDLPPLEAREKPTARKITTSSDLKSGGSGEGEQRTEDREQKAEVMSQGSEVESQEIGQTAEKGGCESGGEGNGEGVNVQRPTSNAERRTLPGEEDPEGAADNR